MVKKILPEKILFVDDEPEVLNSFRRQLRGKFNVRAAEGGEAGLETIRTEGPFAAVVSDLKMPVMDGITFLSHARQLCPDTSRMMLTGFADVASAIAAVNEADIFRFLTKPCPDDQLIKALVAAIKQHRLVKAERELLEQTLQGSIKVLTDVLGLINPQAFGRTSRITYYVTEMARVMGLASVWEIEAAAMLCQVGCLTLPEHLMTKVLKGAKLERGENKLYLQHPAIASELIKPIPRMEEVSRILAFQERAYDGSGPPEDSEVSADDIPLGARILKVVLDFDNHVYAGSSKGKSLEILKRSAHLYDPEAVRALEEVLGVEAKYDIVGAGIYDLKEGMILAEDVIPKSGGRKLLAKGQQLSSTLIMTIRNYNRAVGVAEPIKVIIPLEH
jgi:response regulator RpfG family c-di-GMP phosphodiesterase